MSWGSVATCSFLSLPTSASRVEQLVMYRHSWMLFVNDDSVAPVAWACVVGVRCQVITASVDGQVMVWDLRMLRCVQTFNDSSSVGLDGGMNCFETCPSRKQIVCAGKSLSVYRQVRAVLCTFFSPLLKTRSPPILLACGAKWVSVSSTQAPLACHVLCPALWCVFSSVRLSGLALVRLAGHGPSAGKAHGE